MPRLRLRGPAATQVTLEPIGPRRFRTRATGPFVEDGDFVEFELGPDGAATRMRVGENYSNRLPE